MTVLVPAEKVVLAGDMAFHVRACRQSLTPPIRRCGLMSFGSSLTTVAEWTIVPGHGGPTDITSITAGTRDYLVFLRKCCQERNLD